MVQLLVTDRGSSLVYWQDDDCLLVSDSLSMREISQLGNLLVLNQDSTTIATFWQSYKNTNNNDSNLLVFRQVGDEIYVNNSGSLCVYIISSIDTDLVFVEDENVSCLSKNVAKFIVSKTKKGGRGGYLDSTLEVSVLSQSPKIDSGFIGFQAQTTPQPKSIDFLSLHRRKILTIIFLILLLCLVFWSVLFRRSQREKISKSEDMSVFLNKERGVIESLVNKSKIPTIDQNDKEEVFRSVGSYSKTSGLTPQEELGLKNKIDSIISELLGFHTLQSQVFFDVGSIDKDVVGKLISKHGKSLVILDNQNQKLFLIDGKKATKIIVNDLFQNTDAIANDSGIVHGITENGKIWRLVGDGVETVYNTPPDEVGNYLKILGVFGNKYYLVKKSGEVKKVGFVEEEASVSAYLSLDEPIPSQEAVSIAIDGFVYLATKNNIFRIVRGKLDIDFQMGLKPEEEIEKILVTADTRCPLLSWSKKAGNIICLERGGGFIFQTHMEVLKNAADIFLDPKDSSLYVLKDGLISKTMLGD